ncbi:fumarylacetoacetate hydrolase family protein [Bengtsoniella intestinalis]|uniref:fumarylacetoacetate hydrolase family protein n=1 Tax=Bengtsoniella intestinalis TaxID=3073143 RepID=UPI00391F62FE
MKLVTYRLANQEFVGALSADETAIHTLPFPDMNALIQGTTIATLPALLADAPTVSMADVEILSPIPCPLADAICLGMNYLDHAKEAAAFNHQSFDRDAMIPVYFSKRATRTVDPTGIIPRHAGLVQQLDYEAELAVILGKDAFNVAEEDVADYIFGYSVANDVSARVLQTKHKQFYFGKSLDGYFPMGPCILTADSVPYPPELAISSKVNGELRQNSNTNQLMTTISQLVANLSRGMTLKAGTIFLTGTPAGVGMGFHPPKFLEVGDVVECAIESIGTICNTVK